MTPPKLSKSRLFFIGIFCCCLLVGIVLSNTKTHATDPISKLEELYGPDVDRSNDTGVLAVKLRNQIINACNTAAQKWVHQHVSATEQQEIMDHCGAFQDLEGIDLGFSNSSSNPETTTTSKTYYPQDEGCKDHTLTIAETYMLGQGKNYIKYETLTEYYEDLLKWLDCIND